MTSDTVTVCAFAIGDLHGLFFVATKTTGGKFVEKEINNKEDIGQMLRDFGLFIVGGFATLMLTFLMKGVIEGTEAKAIIIGLYLLAFLIVVLGTAISLITRSRRHKQ